MADAGLDRFMHDRCCQWRTGLFVQANRKRPAKTRISVPAWQPFAGSRAWKAPGFAGWKSGTSAWIPNTYAAHRTWPRARPSLVHGGCVICLSYSNGLGLSRASPVAVIGQACEVR